VDGRDKPGHDRRVDPAQENIMASIHKEISLDARAEDV